MIIIHSIMKHLLCASYFSRYQKNSEQNRENTYCHEAYILQGWNQKYKYTNEFVRWQYFEDKCSRIKGYVVIGVECYFYIGRSGIFFVGWYLNIHKLSKEANHVILWAEADEIVSTKALWEWGKERRPLSGAEWSEE